MDLVYGLTISYQRPPSRGCNCLPPAHTWFPALLRPGCAQEVLRPHPGWEKYFSENSRIISFTQRTVFIDFLVDTGLFVPLG